MLNELNQVFDWQLKTEVSPAVHPVVPIIVAEVSPCTNVIAMIPVAVNVIPAPAYPPAMSTSPVSSESTHHDGVTKVPQTVCHRIAVGVMRGG